MIGRSFVGFVAAAVVGIGTTPLRAEPPPSFAETGGYVLECRIDAPAEAADAGSRVTEALRQRLDPDKTRGVEFIVDGAGMEVRVPLPQRGSELRKKQSEQFIALCLAGLERDARAARIEHLFVHPAGELRMMFNQHGQDFAEHREDLQRLAETCDAYRRVCSPLDDAGDAAEVVRAPGVVELRIAVAPNSTRQEQACREHLAHPETPMPAGYKWFPIAEQKVWNRGTVCQDQGQDLVELRADPVADLQGGGELVSGKRGEEAFLLLMDTPQTTLTRPSVKSSQIIASEQGPAILQELNDEGSKALLALTTPNVNKPLAVLVDGKVLIVPTLRSPISQAIVFPGGIELGEAERLKAATETPLPYSVRVLRVRMEMKPGR